MVTSSDIYSAATTVAAFPYQLLSIPASYNRIRCCLPTVIVRWTSSARPLVHLVVGLFGPVHVLVGQPLAWSGVLPGSLKHTCGGRLETPVSNPVQHDRRLIGPKSLRDDCSATRLGQPFHRGGCSDGAASLVWATSQRGPHIVSVARPVLPSY